MKIYTKTGDKGQTSLLGGVKTSKSDPRVWSYGTIDEVNSSLGFARSQICDEKIKEIILKIQKTLFEVGAELASIGTDSFTERIHEEDVTYLEATIDSIYTLMPKINCFIVPGGTNASAALDVARTKIRTAERYIVELKENYVVGEALLKYVNRLSDALYTFARYEDFRNVKTTVKERIRMLMGNNMNRELGEHLVKSCIKKAEEIGVPMVICVADINGNPVVFVRMDGALLVSIEVAMGKAYTSAAFKLPTNELYELSKPEGSLYGINKLDKIITFGGGYPLISNGEVIGSIGVSGGTVEEDMMVASSGVNCFKEMI